MLHAPAANGVARSSHWRSARSNCFEVLGIARVLSLILGLYLLVGGFSSHNIPT